MLHYSCVAFAFIWCSLHGWLARLGAQLTLLEGGHYSWGLSTFVVGSFCSLLCTVWVLVPRPPLVAYCSVCIVCLLVASAAGSGTGRSASVDLSGMVRRTSLLWGSVCVQLQRVLSPCPFYVRYPALRRSSRTPAIRPRGGATQPAHFSIRDSVVVCLALARKK